MKRLQRAAMVLLILIISTSCNSAAPATAAPLEPTPTVNLVATQSAQQTLDAQATAQAASTQAAQATTEAQATADAIMQATAAVRTQAAMDKAATTTAKAKEKAAATAAVKATAQAEADAFFSVVKGFYDEGKIGTVEGDYFKLDDYARSEAKLNYFSPDPLGYEAENFVWSADLTWLSASENANWFASGCGVLYGMQSDGFGQAILTYLGLDGLAHTLMGYKQGWPQVAVKRWGKPDLPKGEASMTVVLWDKRATVYVDDKLTSEYYAPLFKPGDIGLTVVSGTNKDFGTLCEFTNMNLFILK